MLNDQVRPPTQCPALCLPKISSAQVGVAIWFRRGPGELVALLRSARCGMMIGCAAPAGLPGCDECVRVTAPASGERPGQGRRDPGAVSPDHGPGAAARHEPAAVLPRRPGGPFRVSFDVPGADLAITWR